MRAFASESLFTDRCSRSDWVGFLPWLLEHVSTEAYLRAMNRPENADLREYVQRLIWNLIACEFGLTEKRWTVSYVKLIEGRLKREVEPAAPSPPAVQPSRLRPEETIKQIAGIVYYESLSSTNNGEFEGRRLNQACVNRVHEVVEDPFLFGLSGEIGLDDWVSLVSAHIDKVKTAHLGIVGDSQRVARQFFTKINATTRPFRQYGTDANNFHPKGVSSHYYVVYRILGDRLVWCQSTAPIEQRK